MDQSIDTYQLSSSDLQFSTEKKSNFNLNDLSKSLGINEDNEYKIVKENEDLKSRIQHLILQLENNENKILILKNHLQESQENDQKYKNLYMQQLQINQTNETELQTVLENFNCNQSYVKQLEKNISKLENQYFEIYSQFHNKNSSIRINNLKLILEYIDQLNTQDESHEQIIQMSSKLLEEQQIKQDKYLEAFDKQITKQLKDQNEDLQRNLAIARMQLLEMTQKIEDQQGKIVSLEEIRLDDLKYIMSLEEKLFNTLYKI